MLLFIEDGKEIYLYIFFKLKFIYYNHLQCRFTLFVVFLLTVFKIQAEIVSPCPKYFVFEPNKSEDDRWYGIITLTSRSLVKGVTIDLQFDKSIIQLGVSNLM